LNTRRKPADSRADLAAISAAARSTGLMVFTPLGEDLREGREPAADYRIRALGNVG
jgi:hypothetical protein